MRIDAFLLNNELDMMELRLGVLSPVMDKFVVLESTVEFSGRPKPLYYADNRSRFAEWNDRIIHVVVNDTPDSGNDRWAREHYQRNMLKAGLKSFKSNDLVFMSDVDEIPDPETVKKNMVGGYHQVYSMYFVNTVRTEENWVGTLALWQFQFRQLGCQHARDTRHGFNRVEPGGWHFAYAMSDAEISEKLKAFAHSEWDRVDVHASIGRRRNNLDDLFGVHKTPLKRFDIQTGYFPEYLKKNCGAGQKYARWNCVGSTGPTGPQG